MRSDRPFPRPAAARSGPEASGGTAPIRSADLIGEVLARLGGAGRAREFRVFDCFQRVVGANFRARTMPERLTETTLFVRVANSALAHELTLLRGEILARMTAELGRDSILELRTRVGRIPPSV